MQVCKITLTFLLLSFSVGGVCQVISPESQIENPQRYFESVQPNFIEIAVINLVLANIDNDAWLQQLAKTSYADLTNPNSQNVCVFNQIKPIKPSKQKLFSLPVNLQPNVMSNNQGKVISPSAIEDKPQILEPSKPFVTRYISCESTPQGQRIIADINQALRQLYKSPIFIDTHLKYIEPTQQPAFMQAFEAVFVIAEQQVLKYAVSHFPPYAFLPEDKPPHGINIDAIEAIGQRLNMQIEYIQCPFARCIRMLETGMVDIYIGLTYSVARNQFMHFIEPFIARSNDQSFYVKSTSEVTINEFKDLNELTIGVLRNALYYEQFDKVKTFNKIATNSNPKLIELLLRERIDTFIGSREIFEYLLEEQGLSDVIIRQSYQHNDHRKAYLVLSKRTTHNELLPALSEAVDYVKSQGVFKIPNN